MTKYDARHQLKQLGWTDEELDAIGLTLYDEGNKFSFPERPWATMRYKDLEELPKKSNFGQSIKRLFGFTE